MAFVALDVSTLTFLCTWKRHLHVPKYEQRRRVKRGVVVLTFDVIAIANQVMHIARISLSRIVVIPLSSSWRTNIYIKSLSLDIQGKHTGLWIEREFGGHMKCGIF